MGTFCGRRCILVIIALFCSVSFASASIVWVDDDYSPGGYNDGHTWGVDAFNTIQDGIDAAASGGTVHVAAGTYVEKIALITGIKVLGAGADSTIIDGNYNGYVVRSYQCNSDTLLDGFTIKNGADYIETDGSMTVVEYGAGMFNNQGSPTVSNCVFVNNSSGRGGGGMYNFSSSPTVRNCLFINNAATYDPVSGAPSSGGGIFNNTASNAVIVNCRFINNSATYAGGGVYAAGSGVIVVNCVFSGNSADFCGGGVECRSILVTGCTFIGNSGGGLSRSGSPTITNCIFRGNIGGEIISGLSSGNAYISYSNIAGCGGSGLGWKLSDFDYGGNIDADPLFVDAVGGNFRLGRGSPCIDAGSNAASPGDVMMDLNGWSRFIDDPCTEDTGNGTGAIVDMGAYEFLGADIDGSGAVTLGDLGIVASHWQETGGDCAGADMNCDGAVDMADMAELAESWLGGPAVQILQLHLAFDESDGNIATDSSSYGLSGLLVNGPVWTTGVLGGALAFDGEDDYVVIPGYKGITGGGSRTCTAWIKPTATGGEIMGWGILEAGAKWAVCINENGILRVEAGSGYIFGTTPLTDGAWHHIAVVLNNDGSPNISETKLYVNGNLETTGGVLSRQVHTSPAVDVRIGVHEGGWRYFEGLIDDVRIYAAALTPQEIQELSQ